MDPFDLRQWPGFLEAGGNPAEPAIIDQVSIDSRRITSPHSLFVPLLGSQCDGHQFLAQAAQAGARYALVRKNWPSSLIPETMIGLQVDNPLHAFQDVAKSYRQQLSTTFIGITGTHGKTMVKDLLKAMIGTVKATAASPESFNSQIGATLSLFTVQKQHEIALIEAGISQKGEMDRLASMILPDNVIITHIGKKHLATLGNMETLANELFKLPAAIHKSRWTLMPESDFFFQPTKATVYLWNKPQAGLPHAHPLTIEHSDKMSYRVDFPDGAKHIIQTSVGFYYFLDLLNITVKAAHLLQIPASAICQALSQYHAEPMRTEIWQSPLGTTFINDTYCSDPQSVDRALQHLQQFSSKGKKVFLFGGMRDKQTTHEGEYRRIGQAICRARADHLILIGNDTFFTLTAELSHSTQVSHCKTFQEAVELMRPWIHADDTVLIKGSKKESLDQLIQSFNDSLCSNQCLINLAAIESNLTTIRTKLPESTRIMMMVKALAYGTNDVRLSKGLSNCGVDILGVSYVDEGVSLKRAGVTQAIFTINATTYEAAKAVKWGLEVGVSGKELIDALAYEARQQNKKVKVHLHVDTGMGRFGCRPEEAVELAQAIQSHSSLFLEGIMTHFASADDPMADTFTKSQVLCFDNIIAQMKSHGIYIPWRHAANSSAALRFNLPQYNMVRIGLAAYGLYPSEEMRKALDLRLAISLVSRIVGINSCRAGDTISYGRSYTIQRDSQRIAVLPIGYFDGMHRHYSGKNSVIIRGRKAPMVGNICMDFMMVDITDIPNAAIGDSVLIFGEDEHGHYLPPENFASSGNSIIHELMTCLGPRIQRIFIYEEALTKKI